VTGHVACVGTWCGHDTDGMGHQDNPCTTECSRCLVRGICQWGAAERSFGGDGYASILAHYQPQLTLVSLQPVGPGSGRLEGFVRADDAENPNAGIAGALVELSLGWQTSSAEDGYYLFTDLIADQTVTVSASAPGFEPATADVYLDPGTGTWQHSIALISIRPDGGIDAASAADRARAHGDCACEGAPATAPVGASLMILLILWRRSRRIGRPE
ncbi:MAG: carboxypeptidase regulatory-like domain-containing protein, partial [Deltaproteobacteria bacterium]|nr:carboxypeptidase regulatory-like domain-containing protein [Deltaproteobacteria bacterium]